MVERRAGRGGDVVMVLGVLKKFMSGLAMADMRQRKRRAGRVAVDVAGPRAVRRRLTIR